jgi:pimeloyl-ACP methyl ester carboxylesterase
VARHLLQRIQTPAGKIGGLVTLGALALAGSAAIVNRQAARAEKANPPRGSFVTSDGVRLHYIEQGRGRPIVFLHGNGMTVEDMRLSGVMDIAAEHSFRAIAFDRPGFGHSERPRVTAWTAAAQAALLPKAFELLGIDRPIVVGHSLGTMVALALALNHPDHVAGLVLASGYYFPKARADIALFSPPAIPLLGDLLLLHRRSLDGGSHGTSHDCEDVFSPRRARTVRKRVSDGLDGAPVADPGVVQRRHPHDS